jgi:hypothetical protein
MALSGPAPTALGLERRNWALGLTATFPVLDIAALHFRKQIEQSNERALQADYEKTFQNLTAQSKRAKSAYESAVLVSENTPVELQAAQLGERQARTRAIKRDSLPLWKSPMRNACCCRRRVKTI